MADNKVLEHTYSVSSDDASKDKTLSNGGLKKPSALPILKTTRSSGTVNYKQLSSPLSQVHYYQHTIYI